MGIPFTERKIPCFSPLHQLSQLPTPKACLHRPLQLPSFLTSYLGQAACSQRDQRSFQDHKRAPWLASGALGWEGAGLWRTEGVTCDKELPATPSSTLNTSLQTPCAVHAPHSPFYSHLDGSWDITPAILTHLFSCCEKERRDIHAVL